MNLTFYKASPTGDSTVEILSVPLSSEPIVKIHNSKSVQDQSVQWYEGKQYVEQSMRNKEKQVSEKKIKMIRNY